MTVVALGLLRRGNRWFLQRRDPANAVLPGLWEFPGGKVETGETPLQALVREWREETGTELEAAEPWPAIEGTVRLCPFLVTVAGAPRTALAWGWFTVEELRFLAVPPANRPLILSLAGLPQGPEPRTPPAHLIV